MINSSLYSIKSCITLETYKFDALKNWEGDNYDKVPRIIFFCIPKIDRKYLYLPEIMCHSLCVLCFKEIIVPDVTI